MYINILSRIKYNTVSLILGASDVIYPRYIVMVVLFQIELAYSSIFWDLTSIFLILTLTIVYLILTEYNISLFLILVFHNS